MSGKISIQLGELQKTLFLPMWGRAAESKKRNPLLRDPTAVEIMNRIDYDFSQLVKNIKSLTQLAWIARSILVDEIIAQFLRIHPAGAVVNIGCGLDTTYDRVDNGMLRWYDLDLPDVIALRRRFIPETQRRKFIACSFLDDDWLRLLRRENTTLFIAAGVLYYYEEDQIREFLRKIAPLFPGSEMVFDACSPLGVRAANKMVITSSGLGEKSFLKWGLKDAKEIQSWDRAIRVLAEHSYFKGMKKGFTFRDRIEGLISDALKIQWLVHLQFDPRL